MAHNTLTCQCPRCQSKRAKSKKKYKTNDNWVRFRSDARAYHEQIRREDERFNNLCGEVIVTKINKDNIAK